MCEQWVFSSQVDVQKSEKDWHRCSDDVAKSKEVTKLYRQLENRLSLRRHWPRTCVTSYLLPSYRVSLTRILQILQIWRRRRSPTLRAYDLVWNHDTFDEFHSPFGNNHSSNWLPWLQVNISAWALPGRNILSFGESHHQVEVLVETILQSWSNLLFRRIIGWGDSQ